MSVSLITRRLTLTWSLASHHKGVLQRTRCRHIQDLLSCRCPGPRAHSGDNGPPLADQELVIFTPPFRRHGAGPFRALRADPAYRPSPSRSALMPSRLSFPTARLNTGAQLPLVGLGTYRVQGDEVTRRRVRTFERRWVRPADRPPMSRAWMPSPSLSRSVLTLRAHCKGRQRRPMSRRVIRADTAISTRPRFTTQSPRSARPSSSLASRVKRYSSRPSVSTWKDASHSVVPPLTLATFLVWNNRKGDVRAALDESLAKLQLDYVDLSVHSLPL